MGSRSTRLRTDSQPQDAGPRNSISAQSPLVSIIITSYNYGCYIQDAIDSALKQTHPNIEIIIVDDGSKDNTREVAAKNPVTYSVQRHQGVSSTKNNGIRLSKGEFFVCLDGDDKLSPRYVEVTLAQILRRSSTGFVYAGSVVWNESTGREDIWMPRKLRSKYSLFAGWHGALGPILVRRRAFDSLNQGFDPTFPAYEDMDLCFRILSRGWKSDLIYAPIHWYRIHPNSLNPVTPEQRKIAEANINQKYWFRPLYRKFNCYYMQTLGRVTAFLIYPAAYLRGVKKKIQVNAEVKSFQRRDASTLRRTREIRTEINSTVDELVEWSRNDFLRAYYKRRVGALEVVLSKITFDSSRKTRCPNS
jgi:glycosyltransferase involved in cell wall biosynthesis